MRRDNLHHLHTTRSSGADGPAFLHHLKFPPDQRHKNSSSIAHDIGEKWCMCASMHEKG